MSDQTDNTIEQLALPILEQVLLDIGWKQDDLAGFHAFRKFRVTHLRKQKTPEDCCASGSGTVTRRSQITLRNWPRMTPSAKQWLNRWEPESRFRF